MLVFLGLLVSLQASHLENDYEAPIFQVSGGATIHGMFPFGGTPPVPYGGTSLHRSSPCYWTGPFSGGYNSPTCGNYPGVGQAFYYDTKSPFGPGYGQPSYPYPTSGLEWWPQTIIDPLRPISRPNYPQDAYEQYTPPYHGVEPPLYAPSYATATATLQRTPGHTGGVGGGNFWSNSGNHAYDYDFGYASEFQASDPGNGNGYGYGYDFEASYPDNGGASFAKELVAVAVGGVRSYEELFSNPTALVSEYTADYAGRLNTHTTRAFSSSVSSADFRLAEPNWTPPRDEFYTGFPQRNPDYGYGYDGGSIGAVWAGYGVGHQENYYEMNPGKLVHIAV